MMIPEKAFHFLCSHFSVKLESSSLQVRQFFRALALVLGALHVYAAIKSQSMNADGISYLDIGDAYLRADWPNAINPVWSPLYSWILGFVNFLFRPAMNWEFPTVHIVNFIIFLATLASFEFMWKRVRLAVSDAHGTEILQLPCSLWWTLGYLLFIWTSLSMIQIWSVTPDMLMAALVFLAAGLLAQIRAGNGRSGSFFALGLVLGLGYLSKTFMFSMALIFLTLMFIVVAANKYSFLKTALAVGIFLLISLPFILLLSEKKGKFTIGEAGTVTYLRYVEGMPFPHWQGDGLSGTTPIHPSRIIHQSPTVYEFGEPIGGTYPISTDPSYWYEGIEPRFDLAGLLTRLFASSFVYADLFIQKQGILLAGVSAMYAMGQKKRIKLIEILHRWALVIPAVIAFGLYGTVLVQDRYVGVFVLLFWADILANIRLPDTMNNKRWLTVLSTIGAVGLLVNIAVFNLDGFNRLNPSLQFSSAEHISRSARPLEVAQSLQALGIKQGDKVGVIGYAYDSFWARLARVKIVAEMLETDAPDFWHGNDGLQRSVLRAFASAGAKAVIAESVPEYASSVGWHRVGDSNYYIYILME